MQVVILDAHTVNPGDLSWLPMQKFGEYVVYAHTPASQVVARCANAPIVLSNKINFSAAVLAQLPNLRYIGVTATGYNTIDIQAAKKQGIIVTNIPNYGTPSVAQHTFALLLHLTNAVAQHHKSVQQGQWDACANFCYCVQPMIELSGKIMGIIGLGNIGQQVARIALAFGMQVIAYHTHPQRDAMLGVKFVSLAEIFKQSDVLSLHCRLSETNRAMVNAARLKSMKKTAYLINTARGPLIDEQALYETLQNDGIAGAALDVLSIEPPTRGNILYEAKNCVITPHNAWCTRESRQRLLDIAIENIVAYKAGKPQNVVG